MKSTRSLPIFQLFLFYLEKEINDKRRIFFHCTFCSPLCQRAEEEDVVIVAVAVTATECLTGTIPSTFLPATEEAGEGGP